MIYVEMAGPFMITGKKGKGNCISNYYLWFFICLVRKAVHFELVGDLNREAFTLSYRRYVARRGKLSVIFVDNG